MINSEAKEFIRFLANLGSQSTPNIVIGRVVDTAPYKVKIQRDRGISDWLYQFTPTPANKEDVVIGFIGDNLSAYFGIMEPRHANDTETTTEYTTPRIASDIWDLDNPPVPW